MYVCGFFFFKQKTAYEMRISDWSSDVCSSDLSIADASHRKQDICRSSSSRTLPIPSGAGIFSTKRPKAAGSSDHISMAMPGPAKPGTRTSPGLAGRVSGRSEEHTSELQSLMRISYAVFCLKKKQKKQHTNSHTEQIEHS